MLKSVGSSGQLTLGKRYAGRYFEIEERANGELLLRPVKVLRDTGSADEPQSRPEFEIAEVEQVVLPSREERNARR
ncbi:MAG: hypothetical protein KF909_00075 [Rhodocyclaceae bacterium]|nr:hypothetical protein [Rhodocyclaceae bacterium]MCP5240684.1 hypothetical protein [Zoogloeaceae bacterium]MCB1911125.1 hypothetical protein [Rhodocyclaceae bacterium]MCP5253204.1 hypothetical protein [Zoogloeaceae bacterium]MCP5293461.1 hypothetical protein [Zoogloeaceae bacterium]